MSKERQTFVLSVMRRNVAKVLPSMIYVDPALSVSHNGACLCARRDLIIKFSPPEYPSPTSLANFGLGEWYEVTTDITLKGGATIGAKAKADDGKGPKAPGSAAGAQFKTGLQGTTVVSLTARCYLLGKKD